MGIPERKLSHMMNWGILGAALVISQAPEGGYYAVGDCDGFRGIITATTLDELYRRAKDGIKFFQEHTKTSDEAL